MPDDSPGAGTEARPSGLTLSYEEETGQVVMDGPPTGAAGEAGLAPADGLELIFDCADGHLARVIVDSDERGGLAEPVSGPLKKIFGQLAPAAIPVVAQSGIKRMLSPDPYLTPIWSRLARLDCTRQTSPVPSASPLWAAEAAQLAHEGGLPARARAEAHRAAVGLASFLRLAPISPSLADIALAVAELVESDQPDTAQQLRDQAKGAAAGATASDPVRDTRRSKPGPAAREGEPQRSPGLAGVLDTSLMPAGVFQRGTSPLSDLSLSGGNGEQPLVVEGTLLPEPDRLALSRCRARLVDPLIRRILSSASFVAVGAHARAELVPTLPLAELAGLWIEVVDDEDRIVRSERLHRIRRAIRWADTALRAERTPADLAGPAVDHDWRSVAIDAWERCQANWEAAGDRDRAYLAAGRSAALAPASAAGSVAPPVSSWAIELGNRPGLREPAFLAESLGSPASRAS